MIDFADGHLELETRDEKVVFTRTMLLYIFWRSKRDDDDEDDDDDDGDDDDDVNNISG